MVAQSIRCHYDVLQVARNADEITIKKAHRKLALKYHPDKTGGCEEAAKEFRLAQQAYECLSDPPERKWYDEHREMILRGGTTGDSPDDFKESSFIFDVTTFHFAGCYDGYGDNDGGFFQVYRNVFESIVIGEREGWISEGNLDETEMPNAHLPSDFGSGNTPYVDVSAFYNNWEGFTSCLSFAYADTYDIREAESRYAKRRIKEENQKARKIARKERVEEVIQLVLFVKKRDPRVMAAREKALQEKQLKAKLKKEDDARKRKEAAIARENWKLEREQEMRDAELADLNAGRIRLADLSDSDDEYYRSGRKKGKKSKRKKNRSKQKEHVEDKIETDTKDDDVIQDVKNEDTMPQDVNISVEEVGDNKNDADVAVKEDDKNHEEESSSSSEEESSSSSEEEEPVIYRCECCRKIFKSEKQLENHMNSKKHKESYKKWLKKKNATEIEGL